MHLSVEGLQIYVTEAGSVAEPALLLLHGWPESSAAFSRVMELVGDEHRVVAMDLPGIGQSTTPAPANDKRTLARYNRGVIQVLGLRDVTLVGHDVGGQIVHRCRRERDSGRGIDHFGA